MKTSTIRQTVSFCAQPTDVYKALMDSEKHSEFTGSAAKISPKIGGRFTTYGGYAEGRNIELLPSSKIVQSWRASDWPEGHESKITFLLFKEKNGTRLEFIHENVPYKNAKDIAEGWAEYCWKPLRAYLLKNAR